MKPKEKYPTLKFLSNAYHWLGVIIIIGAGVYGVGTLILLEDCPMRGCSNWPNLSLALIRAFGAVLSASIVTFPLFVFYNLIQLFIDLEKNTGETSSHLKALIEKLK